MNQNEKQNNTNNKRNLNKIKISCIQNKNENESLPRGNSENPYKTNGKHVFQECGYTDSMESHLAHSHQLVFFFDSDSQIPGSTFSKLTEHTRRHP